jgi:S1-C subfamily serine protease
VTLGVVRDGRPLSLTARLEERGADDEEEEDAPAAAKPVASAPRKGDALGLVVAALPAATRGALQVPRDQVGVVVQEILGADPGADALEEGDLVVEINRKATPDVASYRRALGSLAPGAPAWLYVFRPRQRVSFLTRIEVEKRP